MSNNDGGITGDKLKVYECIFAMAMQFILIVACLIAFFVILYFIIHEPEVGSKLLYGFLEILLSGTVFVVYRHYFPSKSQTNE